MQGSNPFPQQKIPRRTLTTEPRLALLTSKDFLAAQPSLADHTTQHAALIRRAFIAEEHGVRLDRPLGSIVEDADIRVAAGDEIALLRLQTDLRGGVGAAETDDVLESTFGGGVVVVVIDVVIVCRGSAGEVLATAELSPEDGQAQADGGDTAPRGEEAAIIVALPQWDMRGEKLKVRRAG